MLCRHYVSRTPSIVQSYAAYCPGEVGTEVGIRAVDVAEYPVLEKIQSRWFGSLRYPRIVGQIVTSPPLRVAPAVNLTRPHPTSSVTWRVREYGAYPIIGTVAPQKPPQQSFHVKYLTHWREDNI